MNLHDYLQIKDAAAFVGVSPNTLRNWGQRGKLTTYRHPINGYRLYKKTDLEALLRATEQSALPHADTPPSYTEKLVPLPVEPS